MPPNSLSEHDAAIHYCRPAAVLQHYRRAELLPLLSEDERARHARFRFERDKDTYAVAHVLVRRMLAHVAGCASADLRFESGEHGRPEVVGPASACEIRFNLSHTQGLVACAVARRVDIGVDVEYNQREVEILGVAKHVYSDVETAALAELAPAAQRERFFDLWTLKEAYIKAIGKGFSAPLRSITFEPAQPDPVPVTFGPDVSDDASTWHMRRFRPDDAHHLALALRWRGPGDVPVRVHCSELASSDLV